MIDMETGEILGTTEPQTGSALDITIASTLSRNEKLLDRQDKLIEEIERLRSNNERLQGLYSEAKATFHKLLAEAQAEFETLKRDNQVEFPTKKGGSFKAETASMEAGSKAIGSSLTSRGIALRQPVIDHPNDKELSIVRTTLSYNGYEEHHDISILSAYAHSKTTNEDVKVFGAQVSLVRKYALFAALGLIQETSENKKGSSDSRRSNYNNQQSHSTGSSYPQNNQGARSSAPAHSSNPTAANASQARSEAAGNGQSILEHPVLKSAQTMSDLSAAMNAMPREERAKFTGYFNQRRLELTKAA